MSAEHASAPIDLAREPRFVLAGVRVHPATLEVLGDEGREVLEPRIMQVLVALARSADEVVSRDALNALCWGGRIVGDDALTRCISRLRRLADRFGGFAIETVPRVGYRLSGIRVEQPPPAPAPTGKASIAGLPFANLSNARLKTSNPLAFQAYVTGWFALTRPGENLRRALAELEKAVRLDPGFALAHVCVAGGYALLGVFGMERPAAVFPKARAAVARALEIAPDFADAHAEFGHIQAVYDLDFAGAEASYEKALAIDPNSVHALHCMGLLRTAQGRFDEAIEHIWRAQAQEPLAANLSANIGQAHYHARRYYEAIAQLERALELDGSFAHTSSLLGRCYLRLGEFQRALEVFRSRRTRTVGSDADVPAALALSGATRDARDALSALNAEASRRYVSPYDLATIHLALGDRELALDYLEAALEGSAQPINFVRSDPAFDPLHDSARYRRLASQLGRTRNTAAGVDRSPS
jgi:tetratricopeptide (TPR) repeat protein